MNAQTIIRLSLLALALGTLPGCLAVNMLLGAGSMFVGGPVQYASAAYTVGEYSYQYAVNEKNPGEVIEEKFAWLLPEETAPTEAQLAAAEVPQVPASNLPVRGLKLSPTRSPVPPAHPLQLASAEETADSRVRRVRRKETPATASTTAEVSISPITPEKRAGQPTSQEISRPAAPAPAPAPAPSLARRLEDSQRRFRTMDRLMVAAEGSTRISIPDKSRGINGAWQVRHRIDEQPYS